MESEALERKSAQPSSVQDLPISEKPTKESNGETKKVPKSTAVKKKVEPKSMGPSRDDDAPPWNGITLNKCLAVAAALALLSVGFQVLQVVLHLQYKILQCISRCCNVTSVRLQSRAPLTLKVPDTERPSECRPIIALMPAETPQTNAVDTDDDLPDFEAGPLTLNDTTDQLPEPWFFEGWFGSTKTEKTDLSELHEIPEDVEEPEEEIEETLEEEVEEEAEEPVEEIEELEEAEEPAEEVEEEPEEILEEEDEEETEEPEEEVMEETEEIVAIKDSQEVSQHQQSDKWGLKAKHKYMQTKASKIRRVSDEGPQKRGIFPFGRNTKESTKIPREFKEKPYKEKDHRQKDKERRHEHTQKKEGGKSYKKGREEENKYFKGRHDEKEGKRFHEHKKLHSDRHHG
ncbi:junctional sarcoplasmic reticulum protein 1 isoform X2 [Pelobates fuscus]|uniref:junctional sarcoplasmic reticulum protein 1 isoform X2 n=1 Tax=Pelobates fuscus TaxID=191477 RepID=UPI002FE4E9BB